MPQWDILSNALASNPGEHFRQGMARGLMGQAGSNPAAMNALMGIAPEAGMAMQDRQIQLQQREQQQLAQQLEQHRERIVLGGRLVQQMQPRDQAGWDQVRAAAQRMGIDISDVPAQFDPAYAQGLVQQSQTLDPQRPQQPPNIQREVEYLRSIGRHDLAEQRLQNFGEGAPVVFDINGDGAPDLVPRSHFTNRPAPQQGEVTATNPQTGERLRLNPQTNQWEPMEGGSGSAAPSNFPGGEWIPSDAPGGIW